MKDSDIQNSILLAGKEIAKRFRALDIDSVQVSEYTKRYFKDYLLKLDYSEETATRTISTGLKQTGLTPDNVTVCESGGGIGLLTFICALTGFKKVIYNDLFEGSCQDFQTISKAIGISGVDVVHGDSDSILAHCRNNNLKTDLVLSRNVIEHVYSIPDYLKSLRQLSPNVVLCFSTTANFSNPLVRAYTRRIHKKIEFHGTGEEKGKKSSDSTLAYLDMRRNFIRTEFNRLAESEIESLAIQTRGLTFRDIRSFTESKLRGENPVNPVNGTNTCDPNTGNWAENLLPEKILKEQFFSGGFNLSILPGHWNRNYQKTSLKVAAAIFNLTMDVFPFLRKKLSPYILLVATPLRKD